MAYMYFTKEDILEAEHQTIMTAGKRNFDEKDITAFVGGVVNLVETLFRNNAEKENS